MRRTAARVSWLTGGLFDPAQSSSARLASEFASWDRTSIRGALGYAGEELVTGPPNRTRSHRPNGRSKVRGVYR